MEKLLEVKKVADDLDQYFCNNFAVIQSSFTEAGSRLKDLEARVTQLEALNRGKDTE